MPKRFKVPKAKQQWQELDWLHMDDPTHQKNMIQIVTRQMRKDDWPAKNQCSPADLKAVGAIVHEVWQHRALENLPKYFEKGIPSEFSRFRVRRDKKVLAAHALCEALQSAMQENQLVYLQLQVQQKLESKFQLTPNKAETLSKRIQACPSPSQISSLDEIVARLLEYPFAPHLSLSSKNLESECQQRQAIAQTLNYQAEEWEVPYLKWYLQVKERENDNHTYMRPFRWDEKIETLCKTAQKVWAQRIKQWPSWQSCHEVNDPLLCINQVLQRSSVHQMEKQVSRFLRLTLSSARPCDMASSSSSSSSQLTDLHPLQAHAVQQALTQRVSVVVGTAGTGKTYTIRAILDAALSRGMDCLLLCQYNKPLANLEVIFQELAVKYNTHLQQDKEHKNQREEEQEQKPEAKEEDPPPLERVFRSAASFLDVSKKRDEEIPPNKRLALEPKEMETVKKRAKKNPRLCAMTICKFLLQSRASASWNLIIMEEAGVTDLCSFASLLEHRFDALCMVGDPYQLLPIGLGHPFQQVIDTLEAVPGLVTRLQQVYRQDQESAIMANIRAILEHVKKPWEFHQDNGCHWVRISWVKTAAEVKGELDEQQVRQLLGQSLDFPAENEPIEKWNIVLAPTNKMVNRLNTFLHHSHLQTCLRVPSCLRPQHMCNSSCWVKNVTRLVTIEKSLQYSKNVLCTFLRQGKQKDCVVVSIKGEEVIVPRTDLALAYCLTAHRAQGSEFPSVRVILSAHWQKIDARWLYTSFTRARKQLVLVGDTEDFKKVIQRGFSWPSYLTPEP